MIRDLTLINGMTNQDWLDEFLDEREAYDISQVRLAEAAHYSRSHLNQLLGGKKPITEKARMQLSLALR